MRSRCSIRTMIFRSDMGNSFQATARLPFSSPGTKEEPMKIRKKILDFEYEEVLDAKTRELIRVGCAVAVGCPA